MRGGEVCGTFQKLQEGNIMPVVLGVCGKMVVGEGGWKERT